MRLGIDASNLRAGGGVTHLTQILSALRPEEHAFTRVIVWGGRKTLEQLPSRTWLEAVHVPKLDAPLPVRLYWQQMVLSGFAASSCDLLFVPGGNFRGRFRPFVTMCQNLLPFEDAERRRFGISGQRLRLELLLRGNSGTFRDAQGLIFLTQYARSRVISRLGDRPAEIAIIPHGVEDRFRLAPRPPRSLASCSPADPFRLLYVSTVDIYKHQWHVAEAVASLRSRFPLTLDLVGSAYPPALRRLQAAMARLDPASTWLRYQRAVPFSRLHQVYAQADAFVFASSCENLPNILLEAMASGLPICCSDRGAMPEVVGDAGVYFDPESPAEIAAALEQTVLDPDLRAECGRKAFARAQGYTWERCAEQTFAFLARQGKKFS
ncbi:MAG: glycosyltransferase family 4 protein [Acidobacteria bacterium]|nr:glycosyltransferase family 4 protein [Acidobacteriota bacterium]